MTEVQDQIQKLNERMLKKRLYVVFTTAVKPMSEMVALLPEHGTPAGVG